MRTVLALIAVLYSSVALAQSPPPTVGDKPLVQVQPRRAASKSQSIAEKLQAAGYVQAVEKKDRFLERRDRIDELLDVLHKFSDIGSDEIHLIPTSSDIDQLRRVTEIAKHFA